MGMPKPSKFEEGRTEYPCAMSFGGIRCKGQAVLDNDRNVFVCYKCEAVWDFNGETLDAGWLR